MACGSEMVEDVIEVFTRDVVEMLQDALAERIAPD